MSSSLAALGTMDAEVSLQLAAYEDLSMNGKFLPVTSTGLATKSMKRETLNNPFCLGEWRQLINKYVYCIEVEVFARPYANPF